MKSFDTDIKKVTDKVRLKAAERRDLRDRVVAYMEYHPLPAQNKVRGPEKLESQHFVLVRMNTLYTRIAAGAFAALLIVGVPLAAERAIPGDILYLVKTGINENIQSTFANSPYEKVAFETKLLERRITEARLLASEGKLTAEVEAGIAALVREHATAAQNGIAALRVNDAEEAALAEISFGSALEVQSAVLDTGMSISASSSTRDIKTAVQNAQAEVNEKRGTSTPSHESLMARIETGTTRAYELFASIETSATEEERASIERRLNDIERRILASTELREADPVEAAQALAKTLGHIQKLIVFMTDIDVRENVSLETLIPVELTPEERIAAMSEILTEIEVLKSAIEARVPFIEEGGLLEKLDLGMTKLLERLDTATTSIAEGDLDTAEVAVLDAQALAIDLNTLTTTVPTLPSRDDAGRPSPATSTDPGIEDVSTSNEPAATSTEDIATSTDEQF